MSGLVHAALTTVLLAPVLLAPPAVAPQDPPPERVIIDVATINGPGCRPGTTEVSVAPGNTAFTVSHRDFSAKVGAHLPEIDRRNCRLGLNIHLPAGFTYGLRHAEHTGEAVLAAGAEGTFRGASYFATDSAPPVIRRTFRGPLNESWTVGADIELDKPCGLPGFLNLNTEVRLRAGTSGKGTPVSWVTLDRSTYQLTWRTCPR
ncbi:DUF4360 domain-containing protein [Amycolatopsis samaneae]|uniref:DUF4360 domain-containing protein n=1 Tax=Amycolatopsis samaneae TaxID=664691 RepID=A0ABW5GPQ6_9PSEU